MRWDFVAPHAFDSLRPASPAYPLDGTDLAAIARADPPKVDGRGGVVAQTLLSGMGLQTLRNARGFSRQGAAEEVTALDPGEPCTRGSIQRLEDRGQLPRTRLFLARLDTVYSGGGRAGLERVRSEPDGAWRAGSALRRWRVEFPPWWVGPIWLQPVGPAGPRQQSVLHLIWGPWARRQRVTSGLVATTRKAPAADGRPASDPLYAGLPAGWHLIAGVGAVPTALDVGDGWRPRTVLAALRLVGEALRAVEHAPAPGREPSPG